MRGLLNVSSCLFSTILKHNASCVDVFLSVLHIIFQIKKMAWVIKWVMGGASLAYNTYTYKT